MQRGKSFEDINIGDSASFSKTISETDVYLFAGISGDLNPMHVNEEYAKTTEFGTRIAHGALASSMLANVLGMQLPGLGTVALEVHQKYRKPVYFGDTVTVTVEAIEKIDRMKVVVFKILWTNQRGETISKGTCRALPPPAG